MRWKSRQEWEAGAGLLDGRRLSDQLPAGLLGLWRGARGCCSSPAGEWLGAALIAWLVVSLVLHRAPQEALRWLGQLARAVVQQVVQP